MSVCWVHAVGGMNWLSTTGPTVYCVLQLYNCFSPFKFYLSAVVGVTNRHSRTVTCSASTVARLEAPLQLQARTAAASASGAPGPWGPHPPPTNGSSVRQLCPKQFPQKQPATLQPAQRTHNSHGFSFTSRFRFVSSACAISCRGGAQRNLLPLPQ